MSKKFHFSEDDLGVPFLSEFFVQLPADEYMNPASEVQVTNYYETNISEIIFTESSYNELEQVLTPYHAPSLRSFQLPGPRIEESVREEMHDDEIISLLASLLDTSDTTVNSYKPLPWMVSGWSTTEGRVPNGSEPCRRSNAVRTTPSVSYLNKPKDRSEHLDTEIFPTQTSRYEDNVTNTYGGTTVEEQPATSAESPHSHELSNGSVNSKDNRNSMLDGNCKPIPTGRKHQWYTRGDHRIYCHMKDERKGCPLYFLTCTNLTIGGPNGLCKFRAFCSK
ncbi:hypothetical protein Aperf_G00000026431 [Anoplocephala perfoliata]